MFIDLSDVIWERNIETVFQAMHNAYYELSTTQPVHPFNGQTMNGLIFYSFDDMAVFAVQDAQTTLQDFTLYILTVPMFINDMLARDTGAPYATSCAASLTH